MKKCFLSTYHPSHSALVAVGSLQPRTGYNRSVPITAPLTGVRVNQHSPADHQLHTVCYEQCRGGYQELLQTLLGVDPGIGVDNHSNRTNCELNHSELAREIELN